jgi:hypothetical protein
MDRIARIAASKRANCGPKGLVLAKRMQVRGTRSREERWGPFGYASARHAQQRREVGTLWVCKCRARAAIVKPLSECDFHRRERTSVSLNNIYVFFISGVSFSVVMLERINGTRLSLRRSSPRLSLPFERVYAMVLRLRASSL